MILHPSKYVRSSKLSHLVPYHYHTRYTIYSEHITGTVRTTAVVLRHQSAKCLTQVELTRVISHQSKVCVGTTRQHPTAAPAVLGLVRVRLPTAMNTYKHCRTAVVVRVRWVLLFLLLCSCCRIAPRHRLLTRGGKKTRPSASKCSRMGLSAKRQCLWPLCPTPSSS